MAEKSSDNQDDRLLERTQRCVNVVTSFKDLVIELATEDMTEPETEEWIATAEFGEDGRFDGETIYDRAGNYKVETSGEPEIDYIEEVLATISITSRTDDRRYEIVASSVLGVSMEFHFYDDVDTRHDPASLLDVLNLQIEASSPVGISYSELSAFEALVKGILAVKAAGRLKQIEIPCL